MNTKSGERYPESADELRQIPLLPHPPHEFLVNRSGVFSYRIGNEHYTVGEDSTGKLWKQKLSI